MEFFVRKLDTGGLSKILEHQRVTSHANLPGWNLASEARMRFWKVTSKHSFLLFFVMFWTNLVFWNISGGNPVNERFFLRSVMGGRLDTMSQIGAGRPTSGSFFWSVFEPEPYWMATNIWIQDSSLDLVRSGSYSLRSNKKKRRLQKSILTALVS